MPKLPNHEVAITVSYQDVPITIWYYPAVLTVEFIEHVQALQEQEGNVQALVDVALRMIARWDAENDDGPIPLEAAALRKVPMLFLADIVKAVQEGVLVPKES